MVQRQAPTLLDKHVEDVNARLHVVIPRLGHEIVAEVFQRFEVVGAKLLGHPNQHLAKLQLLPKDGIVDARRHGDSGHPGAIGGETYSVVNASGYRVSIRIWIVDRDIGGSVLRHYCVWGSPLPVAPNLRTVGYMLPNSVGHVANRNASSAHLLFLGSCSPPPPVPTPVIL